MKITFEGKILKDIIQEMEDVLATFAASGSPVPKDIVSKASVPVEADAAAVAAAAKKQFKADMGAGIVQPIRPTPLVDKPVEKRARTEKQLANDERLKAVALARKAAGTMFKKVVAEPPMQPDPKIQPDPQPETVDPAEMVKLRLKIMEELQEAYGNGHHKEVLELLSRFGNGAKSFRELKPEAFVPIRQAIDNGALT